MEITRPILGDGELAGGREEADGRAAQPQRAHRGRGEGPQHHGARGGHQVDRLIDR